MTTLILGLILWSGVHFWKRLAPDSRERMGDKGKLVVTIGAVLGIVLMVIGYRAAEGAVYWGRSPAMTGINNLLMLFAVYLYAASGAKTRITRKIRHPQLTAVKIWAVAHLLVNGDVPSFVLFGGLLAWAVVEVILINRANRAWTPPPVAPMKKEITAIVATVVVFAIIAAVHAWLGYNPFG
ncbi:NnrU family protein [Yoonia sp.]|uniref:NnrU family protein n=1 Tax=Yoonia sp. TaxID=2212373 RepID=UPI003A4D1DCC|nr:NnrU family protein [Loktanella sp.]